MAEAPVLPVLSLCTGGGGLDLGVDTAFRGARGLLYVEREATAIQVLATRVAQGKLAPAHLWSRVDTIPAVVLGELASLARERAVLAAAGFPCQPWSRAGKRRGADDPRHLWPAIDRFLRHVRPGLIVLECVAAVVDGLSEVVGTLAALRYSARWSCVEAWEVGAPHKSRDRWFCLAVADVDGSRLEGDAECYRESIAWLERASRCDPRRCADGVSDALRPRCAERTDDDTARRAGASRSAHGLPHVDGELPPAERWQPSLRSPHHPPGLPEYPPWDGDLDGLRWIAEHAPHLWPVLGENQSGMGGLVHGLEGLGRRAIIAAAGNGVIPEQAALAIGELARGLLKEL